MNRLEKKCLIVSTVSHGVLITVFLFGSAFVSLPPKPDPQFDIKPLTMVPAKLVDGLSGGGGSPKIPPSEDKQQGHTLTPQPPAPLPPEPKKAESKPAPQRPEEFKLPKISSKDSVRTHDDPKKPTQKPPRVDLRNVVSSSESKMAKAKAEAEAKALAAAAERAGRQRTLAELKRLSSELRAGFSGGTVVEVGGPGGEAYADYMQFVRAVYDEAWHVSDEVSDANPIAEVTVTIARNGDVIFSRITKPSGSRALDRSVQRALDKVKTIGRPFPDGARELQRTFSIEFNLSAKRALG